MYIQVLWYDIFATAFTPMSSHGVAKTQQKPSKSTLMRQSWFSTIEHGIRWVLSRQYDSRLIEQSYRAVYRLEWRLTPLCLTTTPSLQEVRENVCMCTCVCVPRTFVWVFVSPTWSCGYAAMATTGSLLRPGSERVCPAVCYISELMQLSMCQKNLPRCQQWLYLLISFGTLLSLQYNVMTAVVRLHANKQPCVMKSVRK